MNRYAIQTGRVVLGISMALCGLGPGQPTTAIANGQARADINKALFAPDTISGNITDRYTGQPITAYGIFVTAYDADTNQAVQTSYPNSAGTYTFYSLAPGDYKIGFTDPYSNYAPVFFDQQLTLAEATPVRITAEMTQTQVNLKVTALGVLQGEVLDDQTGARLAGVSVWVFDNNAQEFSPYLAATTTNNSGFYRVGPLKPGRYKMRFGDNKFEEYTPAYYRNATSPAQADVIEIPSVAPPNPQPIEINMTLRAVNGNRSALVGQVGGIINTLAIQDQFAYADMGLRLVVLNISSPNNPHQVGQSSPLTSSIQGIAVAGKHAYVANGNAGLKVFNVADAGQLRLVNSLSVPGGVTSVVLHNTYAYVYGVGSGAIREIRILSLANPENPSWVGSVSISDNINYITTVNGRLYVGTPTGMKVFDLTQPDAPAAAGEINVESGVGRIKIFENTALLVSNSVFSGTKVLLADLATLSIHHTYTDTRAYNWLSDVAVIGRKAYLAMSYEVVVMNLDNPTDVQPVSTSPITSFYRMFVLGNRILAIGGDRAIHSLLIKDDKWIRVGGLSQLTYFRQVTRMDHLAYLVGSGDGLSILSLANPSMPETLWPTAASRDDSLSLLWEAHTAALNNDGTTLFALGSLNYILAAVDVRRSESPALQGTYRDFSLPVPTALVISNSLAWVGHAKGLAAVNISNPANMALVSSLETLSATRSVHIWGQHAFLVSDSVVTAINIENANTLKVIGQLQFPTIVRNAALRGPYLYLHSSNIIRVIDVSNPTAMIERASLTFPSFATHSIHLSGQRLYVPSGNRILVYDLTTPIQPLHVADLVIAGSAETLWDYDNYLFTASTSLGVQSYWLKQPVSQLVSPLGSELVATEDGVRYQFGPQTLGQLTLVSHRTLPPSQTPPIPGNLQQLGPIYEISTPGNLSLLPGQPFTLSAAMAVDYAPYARTPNLYFWDAARKRWEVIANPTLSNGSISASAGQFGVWAIMAEANGVYLPATMRQARTGQPDLRIISYQLTQGAQTTRNAIPLIAHRPAMLRVYVETSGLLPTNDVFLRISGTRNGVALSGSPLAIGPWATFPSATPASLSRSFNVQLPADWLSGQVALQLSADPNNAIAETNESNNTVAATVQFNAVPPLKVTLVPITYKHLPTGRTYPAFTQDFASQPLMDMYPIHAVSVTVRTPIYFEGNLSQFRDWSRLIDIIYTLKASDGAPDSVVYYGAVPNGRGGTDSFSPALGGFGSIGSRFSIGLVDADILAHELGHNFGLPHAPCGGASGTDPNYPYPNASIGQYGFNLSTYEIYSPSVFKDVMSYCRPKWFSDYNYAKLYENQRSKGQAVQAVAQDALLVRVTINSNGQVSVPPVYALQAALTPVAEETDATTSLMLEGLNSNGEVIVRAPVPLYEIADGPPTGQNNPRLAVAVFARSTQAVAAIRIMRGGQALLTRFFLGYNQQSALPSEQAQTRFRQPELVQVNDQRQLRWGAPNLPALVRYSNDGGTSWTTLGVDVLGGEFSLDDALVLTNGDKIEVVLGNTTQSTRQIFEVN